jgi:hypothetical protein
MKTISPELAEAIAEGARMIKDRMRELEAKTGAGYWRMREPSAEELIEYYLGGVEESELDEYCDPAEPTGGLERKLPHSMDDLVRESEGLIRAIGRETNAVLSDEVKGLRRIIYEFAAKIGVNLYKRRVLSYKRSIDKKAAELTGYLQKFSESKHYASKQIESYTRVCRGLALALKRIKDAETGSETGKPESEPGEEEYITSVSGPELDKQRIYTKLLRYHAMNKILQAAESACCARIGRMREKLHNAYSTIFSIEQYLRDSYDFQSPSDFLKRMVDMHQPLRMDVTLPPHPPRPPEPDNGPLDLGKTGEFYTR